MALLLNVDDRTHIFSLIKQCYPDADPLEKILDWVFDLAETRVVGVDKSNALGISDFGDTEMFVLENLLKDKSDNEIQKAFADENAAAHAEKVVDSIAKIRTSVIFRPLLN